MAEHGRASTGVTPVPPEAIVGQVEAVAEDIGVDAVKIGMLGTVETIEAVERALDLVGGVPVVLDPVMVAESGAHLLEPDARQALVGLLPRATVVTPNLAEARALAVIGGPATRRRPEDARARRPRARPAIVVVTGGHGEGDDVDRPVLRRRAGRARSAGRAVPGGATHGSGCTHSSALAAQLALGHEPLEAARAAQRIAAEAVRDGLREHRRRAPGPVNVLGMGDAGSVP